MARGHLADFPSLGAKNGGPDRDQTDDLFVANEALYQLSYRPKREREVLRKSPIQVNTIFLRHLTDRTGDFLRQNCRQITPPRSRGGQKSFFHPPSRAR